MKTIVSITPLPVERDSRTFKIASSFARLGYRSVVIEGKPSNLDKTALPFELVSVGESYPTLDHFIIFGIIRTLLKPIKILWPILNSLTTYEYINSTFIVTTNCLPKADLYYLHSPTQFIPVYYAAKKYKKPIIYDAHDFYYLWSPFLSNLIERWCIRKAKEIVTVSDGVANLIHKKYGRKPNVIKNYHDTRLDKHLTPTIKEFLGLKKSDFLIVNVGQFRTTGQPMEPILSAMKQLPTNIHLAFLGPDTKNFNDLIKASKLEKRVHLLDPVSPDKVVPFIKDADASIIILTGADKNLVNCLPNKLFQSISAKLILLYPELPEITKITNDYYLGLPINADSTRSILDAITRIVSDENIRKKYCTTIDSASSDLSWENEEKKLKSIISRSLQ